MEAYNQTVEFKALRIICLKGKDYAGIGPKLLGRLDESYFYDEVAIETFNRIKRLAKRNSYIPSYKELFTDPVLSESTKECLKTNRITREEIFPDDVIEPTVDNVYNQLLEYRRIRILYNIANVVSSSVKKETLDTLKLVDNISTLLLDARKSQSENNLIHFGANNNSSDLIKEILYGEAPPLIKTGFAAFDDVDGGGGFFRGSLVVMGAPTSHGKSAMGNQLLINQSCLGYKAAMVPLEMTKSEMTARIMSNLSGINATKILSGKLTENEKKQVSDSMKLWITKLRKMKTSYSILDVDGETSLDNICSTLRPYNYDVVLVDYIGLLSEKSDNDDWRKLGEIARQAKLFAKQNDLLVVMLVQVKEDGVLKYSQAVGDHANNILHWTFDDEAKETGVVTIKQRKARNQRLFDFKLAVDFSVMRFSDVEGFDPRHANPPQEEPVYDSYMDAI